MEPQNNTEITSTPQTNRIDIPISDAVRVVVFSDNITTSEKILFLSDVVRHIEKFNNKVNDIIEQPKGTKYMDVNGRTTIRSYKKRKTGKHGGRKPKLSQEQWDAFKVESKGITETSKLMDVAHKHGFVGATVSGLDKWILVYKKRYG